MLRTFVAMRVLVGGASYLAPNLGARLFGLDPAGNPQAAYWARLFGVRDVALGVGAMTTTGAARRQVLQLTAACDAADLASTLIGRRAGYLSVVTTLLSGGLAVAAGAVAAAAAQGADAS
jgi:hypothetical protein